MLPRCRAPLAAAVGRFGYTGERRWFHGGLSRKEAAHLLSAAAIDTYLVREVPVDPEAETGATRLALSIR